MQYSDHSPERRNLTIISLSAILYYWGGASFANGGQISLPLVQLTFENIGTLAVIYWVAFAWFLYSYARTYGLQKEYFDRDFKCASREVLSRASEFSNCIKESQAKHFAHSSNWYLGSNAYNGEVIAYHPIEGAQREETQLPLGIITNTLVRKSNTRAWLLYPSRIAYWFPFLLVALAVGSALFCLIFGDCVLQQN